MKTSKASRFLSSFGLVSFGFVLALAGTGCAAPGRASRGLAEPGVAAGIDVRVGHGADDDARAEARTARMEPRAPRAASDPGERAMARRPTDGRDVVICRRCGER